MSELLYLRDSTIMRARCILLELRPVAQGYAAILDATPFYVKGGGQPSDTGTLIGANGQMVVAQVVRAPDGEVFHIGELPAGQLVPGDEMLAAVDVDVRQRHARLHTAGEVICAAMHELGLRWPVTTAGHVPSQAWVAFATDLETRDVAELAERLKAQFSAIVARDTPVVTRMNVSVEEAQRLCPMDFETLARKTEPIRLVSPIPGFSRPCMGAHLERTGQVGAIAFRKFRLRAGELSISYDLA